MATRERTQDAARRQGRRALADLGLQLRDARIGAGLSQAYVGRAAGISSAQISRIERVQLRHVALEDIVMIAGVLGLDLSLRLFPGGDAMRDSGHSALLDRLRARLHPSLRWATEVPLPIVGDRRAWDAVIRGLGPVVGVEAETRLHDLQAVARRVALKRRDGGVDVVILLIAATRHNRAALESGRDALRTDFPLETRHLLRSLREGHAPAASGIVLL